MEINDRLKVFVKHVGLSERQFTDKCGLSEGALRRGKNLNGTGLAKVKKTYPELNLYWTLLGEGEMELIPEQIKEESGIYKTSISIDQLVDIKVEQKFEEKFENLRSLVKELMINEMEDELTVRQEELRKEKNNGKVS